MFVFNVLSFFLVWFSLSPHSQMPSTATQSRKSLLLIRCTIHYGLKSVYWYYYPLPLLFLLLRLQQPWVMDGNLNPACRLRSLLYSGGPLCKALISGLYLVISAHLLRLSLDVTLLGSHPRYSCPFQKARRPFFLVQNPLYRSLLLYLSHVSWLLFPLHSDHLEGNNGVYSYLSTQHLVKNRHLNVC